MEFPGNILEIVAFLMKDKECANLHRVTNSNAID